MKVTIDTQQFGEELKAKLANVIDPQKELFREVVTDLVPMVHDRIHIEGKAANGSQIGSYSNAYMKVRTGNYDNSTRVTRGKNKGKAKDAGTATKGKNAGAARNKYNRTADTKIILSLTRQLENDYAVIGVEGGYGIGFNNEHNADKARWNDERGHAKVYDLTAEELEYATQKTGELIAKELNK